MAKIIGFTKKVDGFQTRAGFMSSVMFTSACKATATKLGREMAELFTKRQAGKFLKGEGIVFNTAIKGEGEEKESSREQGVDEGSEGGGV